MKTKIDYVRLTLVLRKHKKIMDLITFTKEILNPLKVADYRMTLDLHLLIYNILLNGLDKNTYVMETKVKQVLENLFEEPLTDNELTKVNSDIHYIKEKRLYTEISWFYVQFRNAIDFFF